VTRVALFGAGLAGVFLAALALGNVVGIGERTVADAEAHGGPAAPAGLAVEQDGYRLVQERETLVAGRAQPYVFTILDADGSVVRGYDVDHEKRLHLIVVSRPLGRFIHVHPRQRSDGAWAVSLTLPEKGSYRVFADFTTDGERRTLGIDLAGRGGSNLSESPVSPYDVALRRDGERLEFDVRKDGKPVEVERYLGAGGHLVVLREGDLAYIHAHAEENELAFDVPFPSEGRYRLFLQFKVGGTIETVSTAVRQ